MSCYHSNQLYSITALTDNTGSITERYAYSAYGEPVFVSATGTVLADSAEDNRYTYTGREWDEGLGFYHFRARLYDAGSGRFCSKDPMRYFDGPSQYLAFHSSPLINLDPSGKWTHTRWELQRCRMWIGLVNHGGPFGGYDCASALLDIAQNGGPKNGKPQCPEACRNEDLESALPYSCTAQILGLQGNCGYSKSIFQIVYGTHKYHKGDLYYALKKVKYSANLFCSLDCSDAICRGCCSCSAKCNITMTITDTYDFCEKGKFPPGGKMSLAVCACALEKAGEITPFSVSCTKLSTATYNTKACNLGTPPPYADVECN